MSDYDSDSTYEEALKRLERLEITIKEIKKEKETTEEEKSRHRSSRPRRQSFIVREYRHIPDERFVWN